MFDAAVFRPLSLIPLGETLIPLSRRRLTSAVLSPWIFTNIISFVYSNPSEMECLLTHCSGLLPLPSSLPLNWPSSTSCFLQSHGIHLLTLPGLLGFAPCRHPRRSKITDSIALGDLASSASHFLCPPTALSTLLFPHLTEEIRQKARICK